MIPWWFIHNPHVKEHQMKNNENSTPKMKACCQHSHVNPNTTIAYMAIVMILALVAIIAAVLL